MNTFQDDSFFSRGFYNAGCVCSGNVEDGAVQSTITSCIKYVLLVFLRVGMLCKCLALRNQMEYV